MLYRAEVINEVTAQLLILTGYFSAATPFSLLLLWVISHQRKYPGQPRAVPARAAALIACRRRHFGIYCHG